MARTAHTVHTTPVRVAVVGSGIAALSVCHSLIKLANSRRGSLLRIKGGGSNSQPTKGVCRNIELTLFTEPENPMTNTHAPLTLARAPAFLCHPFPGRSLLPHPLLPEAVAATQDLLAAWSTHAPQSVHEGHIIRPVPWNGTPDKRQQHRLERSWQAHGARLGELGGWARVEALESEVWQQRFSNLMPATAVMATDTHAAATGHSTATHPLLDCCALTYSAWSVDFADAQPRVLAGMLADSAGSAQVRQESVHAVNRSPLAQGRWHVNGCTSADYTHVVLCTGHRTPELFPQLPVSVLHGSLLRAAVCRTAAATNASTDASTHHTASTGTGTGTGTSDSATSGSRPCKPTPGTAMFSHNGLHLTTHGSGDVVIGSTRHDLGADVAALGPGTLLGTLLDPDLDPDLERAQLLRRLAEVLDFAIGGPLERTAEVWSGARLDYLPDRLPLCGQLPGYPGVHVVAALGGKGMLWGPLAGKSVAASIVDGAAIPAAVDLNRVADPCHAWWSPHIHG